jgi:hypothetical protein
MARRNRWQRLNRVWHQKPVDNPGLRPGPRRPGQSLRVRGLPRSLTTGPPPETARVPRCGAASIKPVATLDPSGRLVSQPAPLCPGRSRGSINATFATKKIGARVFDLVPPQATLNFRSGCFGRRPVCNSKIKSAIRRKLSFQGFVSGGWCQGVGNRLRALHVPRAPDVIATRDPAPLMFGIDLPSTRADRPFEPADLDLLRRVSDPDLARRALRDNAQALYTRPRCTRT